MADVSPRRTPRGPRLWRKDGGGRMESGGLHGVSCRQSPRKDVQATHGSRFRQAARQAGPRRRQRRRRRGAARVRARTRRDAPPAAVPGGEGAAPGRHRAVSAGRLLRDLRRGRADGGGGARHRAHGPRHGQGAARADGRRARPRAGGLPGAADPARLQGRHLRAGRRPLGRRRAGRARRGARGHAGDGRRAGAAGRARQQLHRRRRAAGRPRRAGLRGHHDGGVRDGADAAADAAAGTGASRPRRAARARGAGRREHPRRAAAAGRRRRAVGDAGGGRELPARGGAADAAWSTSA